MSNHFPLPIRMETGEDYSDEAVHERLKAFYENDYAELSFSALDPVREKPGNLSEYVKRIKQTFSWGYYRLHKRRGYFWSDRFKSVLIQSGESLLNCLGCIDLNPIRAGIVERPELKKCGKGVSTQPKPFKKPNREINRLIEVTEVTCDRLKNKYQHCL